MRTTLLRCYAVLSSITAVSLVSCTYEANLRDCADRQFTYRYTPVDSVGERYRDNVWWRINEDNAPQIESSDNHIVRQYDDIRTYTLAGCSTDEVICVRTGRWLFAAPRNDIAPSSSFSIEGAEVRILDCMRSENETCAAALFVSDCRSPDRGHTKYGSPDTISPGNCRQNGWGLQMMYVFDRDRGVIGYADANWWDSTSRITGWNLSEEGIPDSMKRLVEAHGLLSCETPRINSGNQK